ncbi:hypothetical protein KEM52_003959 [Ascosphaera acerosa]|nr:hypothetical protein KEM52_003959 [Ascosphaera acerosa]
MDLRRDGVSPVFWGERLVRDADCRSGWAFGRAFALAAVSSTSRSCPSTSSSSSSSSSETSDASSVSSTASSSSSSPSSSSSSLTSLSASDSSLGRATAAPSSPLLENVKSVGSGAGAKSTGDLVPYSPADSASLALLSEANNGG